MKSTKMLFVKFVTDTIVGGRQYWPGEVAEVDAGTYRELMRMALAVPAVGRGQQCIEAALTADKIRPYYEEQS